SLSLPTDRNDVADTMAWLNRFFAEGGDIPPVSIVVPAGPAFGSPIQFKVTAEGAGVTYVTPPALPGPGFTSLDKDKSVTLDATTPLAGSGVLLVWGPVKGEAVSPASLTIELVDDDGTIPARGGPGPWVTSAYLRAATPIALSPDAAGRLTYYHLI